MSNSTKTSFYSYNNTYALKISTAKLVVAATWLGSKGCTFSTYSDKQSGMTKFYIKSAPSNVIEALTRKYGFFNAVRQTPAAPTRPITQTATRKVRNADELTRNADALKPIEVVTPQLAVECNLFNMKTMNGILVRASSYTCRTVQVEGNGYLKAIALTDKYHYPQTNSDLTGGVEHQTATVAGVEVTLMPGRATTEQLMNCTLNQLYRFASDNNIKGRSSLKGLKNKPALVEKLLGLVKKSQLK